MAEGCRRLGPRLKAALGPFGTGARLRLTLGLFALAGGLYWACRGYLFFGRLNDDAVHWLAAQSLLEGRYADLSHPDRPPVPSPPPGYPLLLVPAAALGSITLAQLMNLLLSLASVGLVLRLLRREPRAALAAAALAALNPLTVLNATPLMTDVGYCFFSLAALAALAGALEEPAGAAGRSAAVTAGLLAAASAWMRTQGVAVIAASGLVLLESRRTRRLAWRYAAAALPLAAAPTLWALWRCGPGSTNLGLLTTYGTGDWAAGEQLRVLLENLRFYATAATTRTLLSWVEPIPGGDSWAAWAAAAALGGFLLREAARALREPGAPRLAATYLVVYLGLHLFWVQQFRRYLVPVLPLLYWLLARGLASRPRRLAASAGLLIAFFFGIDVLLIRQSHTPRPYENVPPRGTFEWLKSHTRPDEALASPYREMFRHYTGRSTLELVTVADPDDWFHRLARYRVRYVVSHPEGETMETVRRARFEANARLNLARLSALSRFKRVHRAGSEPFVIYELLEPERFEAGYARLAAARQRIAAGELAQARAELAAAEETGAALVRLPFYRGTTELLLGRPRDARRWLEEALRREPGFEPAARNLARAAGRVSGR